MSVFYIHVLLSTLFFLSYNYVRLKQRAQLGRVRQQSCMVRMDCMVQTNSSCTWSGMGWTAIRRGQTAILQRVDGVDSYPACTAWTEIGWTDGHPVRHGQARAARHQAPHAHRAQHVRHGWMAILQSRWGGQLSCIYGVDERQSCMYGVDRRQFCTAFARTPCSRAHAAYRQAPHACCAQRPPRAVQRACAARRQAFDK